VWGRALIDARLAVCAGLRLGVEDLAMRTTVQVPVLIVGGGRSDLDGLRAASLRGSSAVVEKHVSTLDFPKAGG
jgi:hypothetical protein